MNCCQCCGIDKVFSAKVAAKELKAYRKNGPHKATSVLIDALKAEGAEGMTLLDIGGGVGAIQHELLKDGVTTATNVDASSAYSEAAKQEADRLGLSDRVTYHFGDFVALAPQIEPADIVTLDSAICCYHDVEALVGESSQRALKLYGYVYPKVTWWMKVFVSVENLYYRVRRNPFRMYLHPSEAIEAVLHRNGLRRRFYRTKQLWQVVVYGR